MRSKQLKTPPPRKTSTSAAIYSERECYECLADLEAWLGQCISSISKVATKSGRGRKKGQPVTATISSSPNPSCAGEIVEYGIKKGWIKPITS